MTLFDTLVRRRSAAANARLRRVRPRLAIKCSIQRLEDRIAPATFVVTTTANAGPGSLRAAIMKADHNHGSGVGKASLNTIKFKPYFQGDIILTSALPILASHILIKWPPPAGLGTGLNHLNVARRTTPGTPLFNIFTVAKRAEVTLQGFTIAGGVYADGGGIKNAGTLTLNNVMMLGNTAVGNGPGSTTPAMGGAIFNTGTLSLNDCTISNNSAAGPGSSANQAVDAAYGGAIANSGTLSMAYCLVDFNSATGGAGQPAGSAGGGAIFNTGTLSVTRGNFFQNSASSGTATGGGGDAYGGAIMNSGKASLSTTLGPNSAMGGFQSFGGSLDNTGTVTITGSSLSGNAQAGSDSFGGAIFNSGTATITGSSVGGSAAGFSGTSASTPAQNSYGGGIDNVGTLSVAKSYFLDAAVGSPSPLGGAPLPATADFGYGGAINNAGHLSVVNVTFINSTATGIDGNAGGAIADSGKMSLTDVTADHNSAARGGGVAITAGTDAAVTSIDSIFQNPQGGNVAVVAGTFESLGHNLFSDDPAISLSPTDLINTDPLLGPFTSNNGGNTETQAPLPGSPALNGGIGVAGITTDQRGSPRSTSGRTDIGAFQTQTPASITSARELARERREPQLSLATIKP
jgi:hypothetical protein